MRGKKNSGDVPLSEQISTAPASCPAVGNRALDTTTRSVRDARPNRFLDAPLAAAPIAMTSTLTLRHHSVLAALLVVGSAPLCAQQDDLWFGDLASPTGTRQAGQIAADPIDASLLLLRSDASTLRWDGASLQPIANIGTRLTGAAIATVTLPNATGLLAFGGTSTTGIVSGQTLLFANGLWGRRMPPTIPPARTSAAMTSAGGSALMFGGRDPQGNLLADTWVFTTVGTQPTWLQMVTDTVPPPRSDAALCADGHGGFLLFGGRGSSGLLDDTWHFDTATSWRRIPTPTSPAPGIGPIAYDPLRDEILHVDPPHRAVWRFDNAAQDWLRLALVPTSPFSAGPWYMQFDRQRGEFVFVDANGGVSVLSRGGAATLRRQPTACNGLLELDWTAGQARSGASYVLHVGAATPRGPVGLVAGVQPVANASPDAPHGCAALFDTWLWLAVQPASTGGDAWFLLEVPPDPILVGLPLDHQALDLSSWHTSHDLVVRVGRPLPV